eukprot:Nk52_evm18s356 gene=Nk52_evmTU18s356
MTSLSSANVQCENDSSGIDLNRVVRKDEFEEIAARFNFDCASIFQHLADGGRLQSLRNRKPFTIKNVYTRVFRVKKDLKERQSTASHSSHQSFGGFAAPESTSASLVSNGSSQSSSAVRPLVSNGSSTVQSVTASQSAPQALPTDATNDELFEKWKNILKGE